MVCEQRPFERAWMLRIVTWYLPWALMRLKVPVPPWTDRAANAGREQACLGVQALRTGAVRIENIERAVREDELVDAVIDVIDARPVTRRMR